MLQQGGSGDKNPGGNGGHKLLDVAVYVLTPYDNSEMQGKKKSMCRRTNTITFFMYNFFVSSLILRVDIIV